MSNQRTSSKRRFLIRSSDEFTNLLAPLFFLLIILTDIFAPHVSLDSWKTGSTQQVLKFSYVHVGLTVLLFLFIPDARTSVKKVLLKDNRKALLKTISIALGIFVLGFLAYFLGGYEDTTLNFAGSALLLIYFIFSPYHVIWQMKGFYVAYDQCNPNSTTNKSSFFKKIDSHFLFVALYLCVSTGLIFMNFGQSLDFVPYKTTIMIYAITTAIVSVLLVGASLNSDTIDSNKKWFGMRFFLFPFVYFSFFAYICILFVHALEYLFIYRQLTLKSGAAVKLKPPQYIMGFSILLVFILLVVIKEFFKYDLNPMLSAVVMGVFYGLLFSHYYLDRLLFRMKDPEIRENIGPLLV